MEGYLNQEVEIKALDLEHREVVGFLTFTAAGMMILFGGVFGGYLAAELKATLPDRAKIPDAGLSKQVALAMFATVGIILWMLRPFHARAREIRVALAKFSEKERKP